ncbi:MAG: adenine nucleotide alpha hydrolase [Vicinamibacteria bacterium]
MTTPTLRESSDLRDATDRLEAVLRGAGDVAIALSGGVDSLTLAAFAVSVIGDRAKLVHAVSPAVPAEATVRVKAFAEDRMASLTVLNAGEFSDEAYRANPANRCYFCKSHLYDAIRSRFNMTVLSGTNFDDLGDYRPGLIAASERGVRHPFVEAGLTKARVRELARHLGLGEIAELPASPCLSSRVETGIRIEAPALQLIDALETELRKELAPKTVRCRIRKRGVVVEMDEASLALLADDVRSTWMDRIAQRSMAAGLKGVVDFEVYRQGSAFLRPPS